MKCCKRSKYKVTKLLFKDAALKHCPADAETKTWLTNRGLEDPVTRKIASKVDAHRYPTLSMCIIAHSFVELDSFYTVERKNNGKKYILGRFGQVGVNSLIDQPSFGTCITICTGRGSHSKTKSNENSDVFRGMTSAEVTVIAMIALKKANCVMPLGQLLANKESLSSRGMILVNALHAYEHDKHVLKVSKYALSDHRGLIVHNFVNNAKWLIRGYTNFNHQDPILPYESAECFPSLMGLFERTGMIQLCSCDKKCKAKRATLCLMALTATFIREANFELGVLLPLSHYFCPETIEIFMSYTIPSSKNVGFFTYTDAVPQTHNLINGATIKCHDGSEVSYKTIN